MNWAWALIIYLAGLALFLHIFRHIAPVEKYLAIAERDGYSHALAVWGWRFGVIVSAAIWPGGIIVIALRRLLLPPRQH